MAIFVTSASAMPTCGKCEFLSAKHREKLSQLNQPLTMNISKQFSTKSDCPLAINQYFNKGLETG